jgi:hypothetical protein
MFAKFMAQAGEGFDGIVTVHGRILEVSVGTKANSTPSTLSHIRPEYSRPNKIRKRRNYRDCIKPDFLFGASFETMLGSQQPIRQG